MDIFCKIIEGSIPSNKCFEDEIVLSIMDVNPIAPGHLLIIPKKHYEDILEIDKDTLSHINDVSKKLITKMMDVYPEVRGVRVVVNYGEPQAVKHFHMHLIPVYENGTKIDMTQEEASNLLKNF